LRASPQLGSRPQSQGWGRTCMVRRMFSVFLLSIVLGVGSSAGANPPQSVDAIEDLVQLAVQRLGEGDFEAAHRLFDQASTTKDVPPQLAAEIAYHRANAHALAGRWPEALASYDHILATFADSHRHTDARFRRSEVLIELGDLLSARRELRVLERHRDLSEEDRARVQIVLAIVDLDRRPTRSTARLVRALERAPQSLAAFYRARGIARLATSCLDAAPPFPAAEARSKRLLARRLADLRTAQTHLDTLIRLGEPEWILDGVLTVARGLDTLADDLLVAPVPRRLTTDQQEHYERGLVEQAQHLWLRALKFTDEGKQAATRLSWSGRRVDELHRLHAALEHKLEGGL
jgi:tetratricopeptide (TPR) repeat protein